MKYLKSIREEFDRVVGFRYSEPSEAYNISIMCIGQNISTDKIIKALEKVTALKFDRESVEIVSENQQFETPDGVIDVDAIVDFDILVYNEREIRPILEELSNILSSAYDINIINHREKKDYGI